MLGVSIQTKTQGIALNCRLKYTLDDLKLPLRTLKKLLLSTSAISRFIDTFRTRKYKNLTKPPVQTIFHVSIGIRPLVDCKTEITR